MADANSQPAGTDAGTALFVQKITTEIRNNFNNSLLLMVARFLAKKYPEFAAEFTDLVTKWHARQVETAAAQHARLDQVRTADEATPNVIEAALRKQKLITDAILPNFVDQVRILVLGTYPDTPAPPPSNGAPPVSVARPPAKPQRSN